MKVSLFDFRDTNMLTVMSAVADELFEFVLPFCGVGA